MKTVFSDTSEVAHLWANQLQDSAKNNGHNFYFSGKTIYSYGSHFPIARHVTNAAGLPGVLFTERTYSNTTGKHIWIVRHAANHLNLIYCYNPDNSHAQNFAAWLRECEAIAGKLLTAKKPEIYLSQLQQVGQRVHKYVQFFDIEMPETLYAALNISNKTEYSSYQSKKAQYEIAEQRKAEKLLKAKHKKELADWLAGKTSYLSTRNGYDYLRVFNPPAFMEGAENFILTSQGVKIPYDNAKALYTAIKQDQLTVGAEIAVNEYSRYIVTEVGKNIRIGCHNFKRDYLLKFGAKLFA